MLTGASVAVTIFVLLTREHEPSYQGKCLTEWLVKERNGNFTIQSSPEANEAIRHIGTNALPYLVRWVDDNSSKGFKSLVNKLPDAIKPMLLRRWANDDFNGKRAASAALAFAQLGDEARFAIPELTAVMNNAVMTNSATINASLRAIVALRGIGKSSIPALTAQLANTNAPAPNQRLVVLSFGSDPSLATNAACSAAVPLLVRWLNNPDESIARAAIRSLGRMAEYDRSQASLVVPALMDCLHSNFPVDTRGEAALALGKYGVSASNATPGLLAAMADSAPMVRLQATNALLKIAP